MAVLRVSSVRHESRTRGSWLIWQCSTFLSLSVSCSASWVKDELMDLANNVAVHMIFRFLTGFAGSAFLSVSGGAISDVFKNENVATYVYQIFGLEQA